MNRRTSVLRILPVCFIALAALSLAGCGEDKGEKIVLVKGTVKHKGQPIPELMVHFVPQTGKNSYPSHAKTDENGNYELMNYGNVKGVPEGTCKVYVTLPPVPKDGGDDDAGKKKLRSKTSAFIAEVLKKYGKQETSPLSFTIKGDQVIDLVLD